MNNKKNNALAVWNSYDTIKKTQKELEKLYKESLETIKQEMMQLRINSRGSRTAKYELRRLKQAKRNVKKELNNLRETTKEKAKQGIQKAGKTQNIKLNNIRPGPKVEFDPKRLDTLLAQPWKGSTFSERIWKNIDKLQKTLTANFHKGVVLGKTIDETAVLLAKDMNVSLNQAKRLVRTETMRYLNNENLRDMYQRGYTQVQEVVTIDERTSTECSACQGKIHSIENAPELPRHPNCRCCLIPVIGTRLSRKEAEERNTPSFEDFKNDFKKSKDFLSSLPKGLDPKLHTEERKLLESYFSDKYKVTSLPKGLTALNEDTEIYLTKSSTSYILMRRNHQKGLEYIDKIKDIVDDFDSVYENNKSSEGYIFYKSFGSDVAEVVVVRDKKGHLIPHLLVFKENRFAKKVANKKILLGKNR